MFLQRARAQLFCRCRTSPIARGDLYYRALLSFSTVTGNTNANERLQDHGSNTTSRAFEETPNEAQIVEVSPRDGLQNEREVSVEDRVQLIKLLAAAGCNKIEAGSFVKPEAVPSMKNTKEVMMALEEFRKEKGEKLKLSCLVPKDNYMQDAIDVRTDEVAVFTSASETFALKNINCGIEKSIERFQPIVELAREHGMPVRGYVSCVINCPYMGKTNESDVARVTEKLLRLGCYEVSLGDTTGQGTPVEVHVMLEAALAATGNDPKLLAVHFHDTFGQAIVNILISLERGVTTIDSSVAGLGGCPYAKGASGNVATEDVIYLLNGLGIKTGIDMDKLVDAAEFITGVLQRQSSSKAGTAISALRREMAQT